MNILFTGYYFDHFSGSQKYICEMAHYLKSQNTQIKIFIASPNISTEIREMLEKQDLHLVYYTQLDLTICYDLVFALHYPIIEKLLFKGLHYKKIINICLSSIAKLERPLFFHNKLNMIIVHNKNLKKILISKKVKDDKIFILPNFLPPDFINYNFTPPQQLKKIAIISNHVPEELKKLANILDNIEIDYIGTGHIQVDVIPEFLAQFDAVISIGKTVQYCLGMQIPIYEYDHFGGCGYINLHNYEEEKNTNFSGRFTQRIINAQEIASELINNYQETVTQTTALKEMAIYDFSCKNIDVVMEKIEKLPNTPSLNIFKPFFLLKDRTIYEKMFSIKKVRNQEGKKDKILTVLGFEFKLKNKGV